MGCIILINLLIIEENFCLISYHLINDLLATFHEIYYFFLIIYLLYSLILLYVHFFFFC